MASRPQCVRAFSISAPHHAPDVQGCGSPRCSRTNSCYRVDLFMGGAHRTGKAWNSLCLGVCCSRHVTKFLGTNNDSTLYPLASTLVHQWHLSIVGLEIRP